MNSYPFFFSLFLFLFYSNQKNIVPVQKQLLRAPPIRSKSTASSATQIQERIFAPILNPSISLCILEHTLSPNPYPINITCKTSRKGARNAQFLSAKTCDQYKFHFIISQQKQQQSKQNTESSISFRTISPKPNQQPQQLTISHTNANPADSNNDGAEVNQRTQQHKFATGKQKQIGVQPRSSRHQPSRIRTETIAVPHFFSNRFKGSFFFLSFLSFSLDLEV